MLNGLMSALSSSLSLSLSGGFGWKVNFVVVIDIYDLYFSFGFFFFFFCVDRLVFAFSRCTSFLQLSLLLTNVCNAFQLFRLTGTSISM